MRHCTEIWGHKFSICIKGLALAALTKRQPKMFKFKERTHFPMSFIVHAHTIPPFYFVQFVAGFSFNPFFLGRAALDKNQSSRSSVMDGIHSGSLVWAAYLAGEILVFTAFWMGETGANLGLALVASKSC